MCVDLMRDSIKHSIAALNGKSNSLAKISCAYHIMMKARDEIRREKLKKLIHDLFDDKPAAFARGIGRSLAQVSQWTNGYRALGDGGARIIEIALKLDPGYFDEKEDTNIHRIPLQKERRQSPEVSEIISLVSNMDDVGVGMCLAEVRKIAAERSKSPKANSAK